MVFEAWVESVQRQGCWSIEEPGLTADRVEGIDVEWETLLDKYHMES